MPLFLAFLLVPLIEIALFIQVGGAIGLWPTLGIVVLTAVAGTYLVRGQGIAAMNNLRRSLSELDDPGEPLAHGAMILVAGALLLTPGFFTDAVGFALLVPAVRHAVLRYLKSRVRVASFHVGATRAGSGPGQPQTGTDDQVVDGQFTEVDPPVKRPTHQPSGWTRH